MDINTAIEKFSSDVREMIKDSLNALKAPGLIYHYTNDAGLKGILESGKLWLTDLFDLNDPSELQHGLSKINEVWGLKPDFYSWAKFNR